jgi:hypothetical protein
MRKIDKVYNKKFIIMICFMFIILISTSCSLSKTDKNTSNNLNINPPETEIEVGTETDTNTNTDTEKEKETETDILKESVFEKGKLYLKERVIKLPELPSNSSVVTETFLSLLVEAYEVIGEENDVSKVNPDSEYSDAVHYTWTKDVEQMKTYTLDDLLEDYVASDHLLTRLIAAEMMVSAYENISGEIPISQSTKFSDTNDINALKSNNFFFWPINGIFEPEKNVKWDDWSLFITYSKKTPTSIGSEMNCVL